MSPAKTLLVRFVLAAALLAPAASLAKNHEPRSVEVPLYGSRHVKLGRSISRVSVGSNEVADVAAFAPDQLLITGKRLGETTVTAWSGDEAIQVAVKVAYPIEAIEQALSKALPSAKELSVTTAGTSLVVAGEVGDVADVATGADIARGFLQAPGAPAGAAPALVNLLRAGGEQQVQLEISFAEVSRSALKEMGVNFWHRDTGAVDRAVGLINPSQALGGLTPLPQQPEVPASLQLPDGPSILQAPLNGAFGLLFALGNNAQFPFTAALSVLANRGYARTLAEPTLVALSGQEATFLAGGEFPLPLPQALGQVVVEFKKFGIQLRFVPTVVNDTIQLKLATAVSDLDFSLGIKLASVTVPGITSRESSTVVRLRDGQSFAVAGLLSDKVRSNVDKFPGLGDLPVLGALFRSTSYRREETELMVVVTARLVRPLDQRPPLPGETEKADPADLELFLLGSQESKTVNQPAPRNEPVGPVGFAREGR